MHKDQRFLRLTRFCFRSKKTHTFSNSDVYLYIPKQMQAMQTTIAIHSSVHDVQYMFAMIESQYPYGFVHNFKPMDWLQRHCRWCLPYGELVRHLRQPWKNNDILSRQPCFLMRFRLSVSDGGMARSSILGLKVLTFKIFFEIFH